MGKIGENLLLAKISHCTVLPFYSTEKIWLVCTCIDVTDVTHLSLHDYISLQSPPMCTAVSHTNTNEEILSYIYNYIQQVNFCAPYMYQLEVLDSSS